MSEPFIVSFVLALVSEIADKTQLVILGFWSLYKIYFRKAKEESRKIKYKAPLAASFLVVLLSEFGDKTQIASALLAAKYLVPIPIFLGKGLLCADAD